MQRRKKLVLPIRPQPIVVSGKQNTADHFFARKSIRESTSFAIH
jgi:hypothetical protein